MAAHLSRESKSDFAAIDNFHLIERSAQALAALKIARERQ
jgi:hypothetical protein